MRFGKFALLALLIAALVICVGCGNIAEQATKKAVENATGVKVDEKNGSVNIKTDKGEATISGSESKVPDGFPKDFPIYDGVKITSGLKTEAEGKTSFQVTFETSDDVKKVVDFYKKALADNGYKISGSMEADEMASLSLKKGDADIGGVTITKSDGKTNVLIGLTE
ncbi:MAG TPA: hypothetical protein VGK02_03705 [Candidatus Aquicultor sp.]|jgi:hypothetical protein